MSGTTTPPASPTTLAEPLLTGQNIIALYAMTILAGTVAMVLAFGTPETKSQTVGGILALGGLVGGFYFGSSRSSQAKDATNASQAATIAAQAVAPLASVAPPGSTTTIVTPAAPEKVTTVVTPPVAP